ncbi:MAG: SGNH/GDSL hydrolase family protein [Bryobacteraceae bacterium]
MKQYLTPKTATKGIAITLWWPCLLAISGVSLALEPAADFYLKPGDRVVFFGDSITDHRLYDTIVETYVVTRYPKLNATFVHSGWSGDTVSGGKGGSIDVRLQRDVIAYDPTVMTIMFGMNDGRYAGHQPADDTAFQAGFRHIVEAMRAARPLIRITAIEPSPYDDVTRPVTIEPDGYNAVLTRYGQWIATYSHQADLDLSDFNTPVVALIRKLQAEDPASAPKIIPDRVHPSIAGHLIMAEALLGAWHARPTVTAVTIDAAAGKAIDCSFASIDKVKAGPPLSWTEHDEALPLPLAQMVAGYHDDALAVAIKNSDVTDVLNREMLRVMGLEKGTYMLRIDGSVVGTWSNEDWGKGVNLGSLVTPMSAQAMAVYELTARRAAVHWSRWRVVDVPLKDINGTAEFKERKTAIDALDALDSALIAKQRARAQPTAHVFEIVRAN